MKRTSDDAPPGAPGGFERSLQTALAHLYDPTHRPDDAVWRALDCDPRGPVEPLWTRLADAIERLRPGRDVPADARAWRIYRVLALRYLRELTQEEVAARLEITPRHLRREQKQAVDVLARQLQPGRRDDAEAPQRAAAGAPERAPGESPDAEPDPAAWRSQMQRELASLRERAPGSVGEVGAVVARTVALMRSLAAERGASVVAAPVAPELTAALHPAALQQLVIGAVEILLPRLSAEGEAGRIEIGARARGDAVELRVVAAPTAPGGPPATDLVDAVLAVEGGSVSAAADGDRASLAFTLPGADRIDVLVVDDNADLVHFYRRYAAGTRYRIHHVAEGRDAVAAALELAPGIVVLDVMLPDADGWELLERLRREPATRAVPVIVCSVTRAEELAGSLGADLYLPKPVRRREFLTALAGVVGRRAGGSE